MGQTPLSIGEQRYLERASALADSSVQAASAPATERAYDRDFADFSAWCSRSAWTRSQRSRRLLQLSSPRSPTPA